MTGRFITFEGGEGCGKSTQVRLLADRLRAAGREVFLTREPGGTMLAEKIRSLVREESGDPPNARAETLLFLASRAQVVAEVIRPALAEGKWVLCDRFADSTFAYQGYGRGLDLQELRRLNAFATDGLIPDRTIKQGFLEMAAAEPERFVVIAADGRVDEVAEKVWNSIRPMI